MVGCVGAGDVKPQSSLGENAPGGASPSKLRSTTGAGAGALSNAPGNTRSVSRDYNSEGGYTHSNRLGLHSRLSGRRYPRGLLLHGMPLRSRPLRQPPSPSQTSSSSRGLCWRQDACSLLSWKMYRPYSLAAAPQAMRVSAQAASPVHRPRHLSRGWRRIRSAHLRLAMREAAPKSGVKVYCHR